MTKSHTNKNSNDGTIIHDCNNKFTGNTMMTTTSTSGVILPNGKLNISLLQREISNDLSHDAKYYAQDEMKKRAIHMSKNYDEFKNFVACSQLKPIHSTEMSQLFTPKTTIGQTTTTTGNTITSSSDIGSKQENHSKFYQNKVCTNIDKASFYDSFFPAHNKCPRKSTISSHETNQNLSSISSSLSNEKGQGMDLNQFMDNNHQDYTVNIETMIHMKQNTNINNMNKSRNMAKRNHNRNKNYPTKCTRKNGMTSIEFEKEWKVHCQSKLQTLRYLLTPSSSLLLSKSCNNKNQHNLELKYIPSNESQSSITKEELTSFLTIPKSLRLIPEDLAESICKVQIDSTIFGNIIASLAYLVSHIQYTPHSKDIHSSSSSSPSANKNNLLINDDNQNTNADVKLFAYRWMKALSQCGRFRLNIDFLDKEQKQDVVLVFDFLLREEYPQGDSCESFRRSLDPDRFVVLNQCQNGEHDSMSDDVTAPFTKQNVLHLRSLYCV